MSHRDFLKPVCIKCILYSRQVSSTLTGHTSHQFYEPTRHNRQERLQQHGSTAQRSCLPSTDQLPSGPNIMKICQVCQYKTFRNNDFQRHMLTHSAEKPYSCDKCNYTCIQKIHLKAHLLTHTGEKPFKCSFCDHRANFKGNVKKHEIKYHPDQLYAKCGKI